MAVAKWSPQTLLAVNAALIAVVGIVGLVSVSRHNVRPISLMYTTDTPSRVPDREKFGMGFNDRLGIKPLCTSITNKGGMVDCVTEDDLKSADTGIGRSGDSCDSVCYSCTGGVLAGPSCDSCLCGVNSEYYASGVAPDDCKSVCYFCRTSMTSGAPCASCSCGLWPAPLGGKDPLDQQLLY